MANAHVGGRRESEGEEEGDGARHVAEVKWMPARRKYGLPAESPGARGVQSSVRGRVTTPSSQGQSLAVKSLASRVCPVPLTVRGTQALVSFAPLAFKLFCAARQNAVLRRSPFPPV